MTTDSEFTARADAALERIGEAIEAALAASDVDGDWNLNDGILEVEWDDGAKLIVNRHVPNREIWVAARSGGFHFRPQEGAWPSSTWTQPAAVVSSGRLTSGVPSPRQAIRQAKGRAPACSLESTAPDSR